MVAADIFFEVKCHLALNSFLFIKSGDEDLQEKEDMIQTASSSSSCRRKRSDVHNSVKLTQQQQQYHMSMSSVSSLYHQPKPSASSSMYTEMVLGTLPVDLRLASTYVPAVACLARAAILILFISRCLKKMTSNLKPIENYGSTIHAWSKK